MLMIPFLLFMTVAVCGDFDDNEGDDGDNDLDFVFGDDDDDFTGGDIVAVFLDDR
jgi:hypothetical protein